MQELNHDTAGDSETAASYLEWRSGLLVICLVAEEGNGGTGWRHMEIGYRQPSKRDCTQRVGPS